MVRDETGAVVWTGATSTARMRRSFTELAAWLVRDNPVPAGSVLLTGTGLVPPDEVSLAPGYAVEVAVAGIGRLVNVVAAAADLIAFAQSSEWKREAPPSASRTEPVM
jgi:2-dehydro-3-deoxy-D-arabinonate dehydratase